MRNETIFQKQSMLGLPVLAPAMLLRRLCAGLRTRATEETAIASSGGRRVLVAGLGNYGMGSTRHSIGMAVLQQLAHRLNVADQWKADKRCQADMAVATLGHVQLVLLKPRRLMNINGRSVASAAEKFGLGPEDIYLLHDELDKPLGKVSLKLGGSARGHNGVRSCIECLHSDVMVRLRVGIGRPQGKMSVERHVLEAFSSTEREVLPRVLEQGAELVLGHIQRRIQSEKSEGLSSGETEHRGTPTS
ncbi:peptidyl-tRNA hydrolase [Ambystoma mexicanum]|uniref:peptidyl-tRNA hydrolase n=1 Tax=Ambystoma mexicanum TaxID=8296 RepID=UPI0037E917FB